MGRESLVACMPTSPSMGESAAPIENSPPGIQTIPGGAARGAGAVLGTVGPKPPLVVTGVTAAPAVDDLSVVVAPEIPPAASGLRPHEASVIRAKTKAPRSTRPAVELKPLSNDRLP